MHERAVVTGVGVVCPTGVGADMFWKATREGVCAIDTLSRYDSDRYPLSLAGEVDGFDAAAFVESRVIVQTDRFTHFAMTAANLALTDAELDPDAVPRYEFGVVTASCSGGVEFGQHEIERLWRDGPRRVGPYQSIAWFYAASTGQISIAHGLKGPCGVLVTDESGGLDALAHAAREVRRGTRVMLAGGAEAPFAPFSMACQYGHGLLSRASDPAEAYLPFTDRACGFVPAEGGAMVVVEDRTSALRRGVVPRASVIGHGSTFTGMLRHDRSAAGLAEAARQALAEADCAPDEVDVVFADALGVPPADAAEVAALRELFGPRASRVPVTAPKAGIGRAYAGSAALDVAAAVLSLEHGIIPPTPVVTEPGHDIDLVTGRARPSDLRTALILSRGLFGGNSALLLRRAESWWDH